jgi:hypothetical protein
MRLGATAGPLDGHAFTVLVDARAGEGAGSSAATFHCITMEVSLSDSCGFKVFFGGEVGEKEWGAAAVWRPDGAVPHRHRQGARGQEGCRRRWCCTAGRRREK